MIENETIRMEKLINDLLAFARPGKKDLQKTSVDMTELFREVASDIVNASLDKPRVDLVIHNMPNAFGDKHLIRQVLVNLLSNAVKFSDRVEKPVVEVGYFPQQHENNEPVYFVKDNGVGFDMKYYDKLFGIFKRLHSPEQFQGTGLGLAIVKNIINRHGGNVWAESEINKGATFYFSLPGYK